MKQGIVYTDHCSSVRRGERDRREFPPDREKTLEVTAGKGKVPRIHKGHKQR